MSDGFTKFLGQLPLVGVVLIALSAGFIAPGATSFGPDEAALIGKALLANQNNELAAVGLTGTFGLPYGPVPTWIYQGLLQVSHEPETIVSLRAIGFLLVTGFALLSLARSARLPVWLAPITIALPWVWCHARQPWDNSFLIPFSAIAFAGAARWFQSHSPTSLLVTLLGCFAMVSTHLMSLPVLAAIGLISLVHRRALVRQWSVILCATAIFCASHYPYLSQLAQGPATPPTGVANSLAAKTTAPAEPVQSAISALALAVDGSILAGMIPGASVGVLRFVPMVMILVGCGLVTIEIVQRVRLHTPPPAVMTLMPMCLLAVLFTALFFLTTRPGAQAHYQHAVLVPLVVMAWSAVRWDLRWKRDRGPAHEPASTDVRNDEAGHRTLAITCALLVVAGVAYQRLTSPLPTSTPTLAALTDLARQLSRQGASMVQTSDPFLVRHTAVLRTLLALQPGPRVATVMQLHVQRTPTGWEISPASDEASPKPLSLTGPIDTPQYGAVADISE
jgi:hypothetical protein